METKSVTEAIQNPPNALEGVPPPALNQSCCSPVSKLLEAAFIDCWPLSRSSLCNFPINFVVIPLASAILAIPCSNESAGGCQPWIRKYMPMAIISSAILNQAISSYMSVRSYFWKKKLNIHDRNIVLFRDMSERSQHINPTCSRLIPSFLRVISSAAIVGLSLMMLTVDGAACSNKTNPNPMAPTYVALDTPMFVISFMGLASAIYWHSNIIARNGYYVRA